MAPQNEEQTRKNKRNLFDLRMKGLEIDWVQSTRMYF